MNVVVVTFLISQSWLVLFLHQSVDSIEYTGSYGGSLVQCPVLAGIGHNKDPGGHHPPPSYLALQLSQLTTITVKYRRYTHSRHIGTLTSLKYKTEQMTFHLL